MDVRLGSALLAAGRITQEALDQALEVQVTTGGRLGSILVSLGHLREEDLAEILAEHYGLPVVDRARLASADPRLFGDFSRDFAAYHQLICLGVEGRTVDVAMVDPGDVTAREVVEERTRRRLRLHVLPERLFWDFAREHYGLQRPARPRWELRARLDRPSATPGRADQERSAPTSRPISAPGVASEAKPDPTPPSPSPPSNRAPGLRSWPWSERPIAERSDAELLATLACAEERAEIGQALEVWGGRRGETFAVLVVRRGHAEGWVATLRGAHAGAVEGLTLDLGRPSVLREVVEGASGYQGIPPSGEIEATLFRAFGQPPPREMLLLPVRVQGRVVNLLYLGSSPSEPLPAESLPALEQAASALAATYLRLILVRRATTAPA